MKNLENLTDNLTNLTDRLTHVWKIRTIRCLEELSVSLPVSLLVSLLVRIHFYTNNSKQNIEYIRSVHGE